MAVRYLTCLRKIKRSDADTLYIGNREYITFVTCNIELFSFNANIEILNKLQIKEDYWD